MAMTIGEICDMLSLINSFKMLKNKKQVSNLVIHLNLQGKPTLLHLLFQSTIPLSTHDKHNVPQQFIQVKKRSPKEVPNISNSKEPNRPMLTIYLALPNKTESEYNVTRQRTYSVLVFSLARLLLGMPILRISLYQHRNTHQSHNLAKLYSHNPSVHGASRNSLNMLSLENTEISGGFFFRK